jgi:hypothetical protein
MEDMMSSKIYWELLTTIASMNTTVELLCQNLSFVNEPSGDVPEIELTIGVHARSTPYSSTVSRYASLEYLTSGAEAKRGRPASRATSNSLRGLQKSQDHGLREGSRSRRTVFPSSGTAPQQHIGLNFPSFPTYCPMTICLPL